MDRRGGEGPGLPDVCLMGLHGSSDAPRRPAVTALAADLEVSDPGLPNREEAGGPKPGQSR
jgi:hypothetical protein